MEVPVEAKKEEVAPVSQQLRIPKEESTLANLSFTKASEKYINDIFLPYNFILIFFFYFISNSSAAETWTAHYAVRGERLRA